MSTSHNLKSKLQGAFDEIKVNDANRNEAELKLMDANTKLKIAQTQLSAKETELTEALKVKDGHKVNNDVEIGSLDDLTSLVQRELDISSEQLSNKK